MMLGQGQRLLTFVTTQALETVALTPMLQVQSRYYEQLFHARIIVTLCYFDA